MKALLCETASAFVDRETGCITGIKRAIQAATAPSLGQQMLQRGSREVIAKGRELQVVEISLVLIFACWKICEKVEDVT